MSPPKGTKAHDRKTTKIRRATLLRRDVASNRIIQIGLIVGGEPEVAAVVGADDVILARGGREGSHSLSVGAHAVKIVVRVDGNQRLVLPLLSLRFCVAFNQQVLIRVPLRVERIPLGHISE